MGEIGLKSGLSPCATDLLVLWFICDSSGNVLGSDTGDAIDYFSVVPHGNRSVFFFPFDLTNDVRTGFEHFKI